MACDWYGALAALAGALIGAGATLYGGRVSDKRRDKAQIEGLRRERRALLAALASELEAIDQFARVHASALSLASRGIAASALNVEIIGTPLFSDTLREKLSIVPTEFIEDVVTTFALCRRADESALRWARSETSYVPPGAAANLADLFGSAADRCAKTAAKLRDWAEPAGG